MINPKLFNFFGWNPTGDFGPWTMYTAKNKKPVMFIKAPPTSPPTPRQQFQRSMFSYIARYWSSLPKETKQTWELAAKRAHLRCTGYNLFVWYHFHNDRNVIQTIERQSGVQLIT